MTIKKKEKSTSKKLRLNKETLKDLTAAPDKAQQVAGGVRAVCDRPASKLSNCQGW